MLHNNVFLGGMTVRKEGILGATVKNIGKHNKPFETSQRHGTSSVPARITLTAPCPAALRSPYFAYVEEFGGHRILSIYDLHADVECCAHIVEAPTILTCIDWGARRVENKVAESSKRKRVPVGSSQAILAYGTSTSKILLISATDATVLGTLEHKHTNGITNLKFAAADNYPQLWSLGNDLHLVQWDTKSCQSIRYDVTMHSLFGSIEVWSLICSDVSPLQTPRFARYARCPETDLGSPLEISAFLI